MDAAAADPERSGMGTTATVIQLHGGAYFGVHVGDSRAYLFRHGELSRLTTDHTWVQEQVDQGILTEAAARVHPYSSVLTQALGTTGDVEPDTFSGDALPGDLFLLCSDGLMAVLDDADIAQVLGAETSLEVRGKGLVDAANAGGGPDNITVVLVRVA
jgi:protein phosphatase